MGKLIYSMIVSLDGFVEDAQHSLDWILIDEELHQYFNDQQAEDGAILYGRRMYETMAAYWPTEEAATADESYIREYARIWKEKPKVVFSKTLDKVEWNSRLVRGDLVGEVSKLKAQSGKNISVGGADLAASCIQLGLVDEYQLFVQPVILGSGTPFFPALDKKIELKLVETHQFGSGVILLRYQNPGEKPL